MTYRPPPGNRSSSSVHHNAAIGNYHQGSSAVTSDVPQDYTSYGGRTWTGAPMHQPPTPNPAPAPVAAPAAPQQPLIPGALSGPGQAENYYDANASRWTAPTQSSQYWQQNQGAMGTPGAMETYGAGAVAQYGNGQNPHASNDAQQAWNDYRGDRRMLSTDPGFGSFYDNAGRQAQEKIDASMAARGAYSSSAANDQVSEAMTNLAADRAKNEANYNLNRLGEQRAWDSAGGVLARGADTSSVAAAQNELDWTKGLAGIANDAQGQELARELGGSSMAATADNSSLNFLNGGMNASVAAQGATRNRYNDMFNNEMTYGNAMNDIMGPGYNSLLGNDQQLLDDSLGMGVAHGTNGQNVARYNTGQSNQNAVDFAALMRMFQQQHGNPPS